MIFKREFHSVLGLNIDVDICDLSCMVNKEIGIV